MRILLVFIILLLTYNSSAQRHFDPCLLSKAHKIVVLGSSTAAGSGPSSRDSAWVWKYRRHLQKLNPAITVTNLAVGGFVSYRIMPHEFKGPVGRPAPDSLHNITHALTLKPDVIIVNLPSNDRQFPIAEQLSNFDSLFRMSNRAGVPMFICTTQPISTAGAYQAEVKDSIYSMFGSYAIDFWSTFADTSNLAKPIYLADGVHYNNLGHRILTDRIINKNVLFFLRDTSLAVDYGIHRIEFLTQAPCSDTVSKIRFEYYNAGLKSLANAAITFSLFRNQQLIQQISDTLARLNSCVLDSANFNFNTLANGTYKLVIEISHRDDTTTVNNIDSIEIKLFNPLTLTLDQDTLWSSGRIRFCAFSDSGSTISWYTDSTLQNTIDSSSCVFSTDLMDTSFYLRSCKQNTLINHEKISGTPEVQWNGVMFDLFARGPITLHSISPLTPEVDSQQVNIYFKSGSHRINTLDSSKWHLYERIDSKADTFGLLHLDISDTSLNSGDTLGIYLEFNSQSSRLHYERLGSTGLIINRQSYGILLGTGVSHNFSAMYYPRKFLGEIGITSSIRCCSPIAVMGYKYPLGVSKQYLSRIKVFPNPATSNLMISTEGEYIQELVISDIQGRLITEVNANNTQEINLNLNHLVEGTYILHINLKNRTVRKKIIIQP